MHDPSIAKTRPAVNPRQIQTDPLPEADAANRTGVNGASQRVETEWMPSDPAAPCICHGSRLYFSCINAMSSSGAIPEAALGLRPDHAMPEVW